jgi:hypothetical protein
LNTPPVPRATYIVVGLLAGIAKSDTRPPMFAGPTDRHDSSLSSSGSITTGPPCDDLGAEDGAARAPVARARTNAISSGRSRCRGFTRTASK